MYFDDLSDYFVKSQMRCHIDNVCVNHVMYTDDICLMAQSPAVLQKLINICYDFSIPNNKPSSWMTDLTLPSHFAWCLNLDCIVYYVLHFI